MILKLSSLANKYVMNLKNYGINPLLLTYSNAVDFKLGNISNSESTVDSSLYARDGTIYSHESSSVSKKLSYS